MKRILVVAVLVTAAFTFVSAEGPKPQAKSASAAKKYTPVTEFDPARDAAKDVADAIAEAGRTGKNIMIDVGGKWCVWCTYFDRFFEANAPIRNFRDQNFLVVKVNYSQENKNEVFLSKYPKVNGYPHLFFLDKTGKLIHSQDTSQLEEGKGYNLTAIAKMLQENAPGAQQKAPQAAQ